MSQECVRYHLPDSQVNIFHAGLFQKQPTLNALKLQEDLCPSEYHGKRQVENVPESPI